MQSSRSLKPKERPLSRWLRGVARFFLPEAPRRPVKREGAHPRVALLEDRLTPSGGHSAPVALDNTVTTPEDTSYTFQLSDFNFSDPNDNPADNFIAVKVFNLPGAGSLKLDGQDVGQNQSISVADINAGLLTFVSGADENGVAYSSWSFAVQDDGAGYYGWPDTSVSQTMTMDVTAVNDTPVIGSVALDNNGPKTKDVLTATIVSSMDVEGDEITYVYVWYVNGTAVQTTPTPTTATTDTLDLSVAGHGNKGDTIQVKVTPSDPTVAGNETFSDVATVVNSSPRLTIPGDQEFFVDDPVGLPILATDDDGDYLSFNAENLPPGLFIVNGDPSVISGTVQGPDGSYLANLRVTDGIDDDSKNFFCQVRAVRATTVVFVNPAPGATVTLTGDGLPTRFTFRVTGTGTPGEYTLYWGVREPDDPVQDDQLWQDRELAITVAENGTFDVTKEFYLFSERNGDVSGPDDSSWERTTDPIYVTVGTRWFNQARTPVGQGITVVGTPNVPAGTTAGTNNIGTITANITLPNGFNGDLSAGQSPFQIFDFTVTIAGGTPNTTVSNLRWSVIEPDDPFRNDRLVLQREFSITIGADGTGVFRGQFILFAAKNRKVSGVDEHSGEKNPDPIYVAIENSNFNPTVLAQSNTITARGVA